ncbi:MAG: hypothetical protein F4X36_20185 [Gammaproteobacteria bacterium]|nr:hypothetical protein [Gammaproteobacteria bacterium]
MDRLDVAMNELSGVLPDSFLQLESLTDFAFEDNDGLCAPDTDEFRQWLEGIEVVTGPVCQ